MGQTEQTQSNLATLFCFILVLLHEISQVCRTLEQVAVLCSQWMDGLILKFENSIAAQHQHKHSVSCRVCFPGSLHKNVQSESVAMRPGSDYGQATIQLNVCNPCKILTWLGKS